MPGLAIAIVKDDRIVLAKGYGVKKLGDPAPVNENTLFAIGSSSKAFTAAGIAMLVDEGKLKWDDPVTKYLPGFELYDPYVTRELTVRDLFPTAADSSVVICSGMALSMTGMKSCGGLVFSNLPGVCEAHSATKTSCFLRRDRLIAKVSGQSWDEFIRQRIFTPLTMTSSNTSISDLKNADNVAPPHAKIEEKVRTRYHGATSITSLPQAQSIRMLLTWPSGCDCS